MKRKTTNKKAKTPSFLLPVLAVTFSSLLFVFVSYADVNDFYPARCEGQWQNPNLAQGRPNLNAGAQPQDFNAFNSAIFSNPLSVITCSNFARENQDNSDISELKKVTLKFSLVIKNETIQEAVQEEIIPAGPTSTPEIIGFVERILTFFLSDEETNEEATESSISEEERENEESVMPGNENETNPQNLEPNPLPELPTELPNPEMPSVLSETPAATSVIDIIPNQEVEIIPEATSSPEQSGQTQETRGEPEVNNSASETQQSVSPQNENPEDDLFEVSWMIEDKTSWQSLGKITKNNWRNLSFDVPVTEAQDLEKLQIAIRHLSATNTPQVFLDGVNLEIEYVNSTENNSASGLETAMLRSLGFLEGLGEEFGASERGAEETVKGSAERTKEQEETKETERERTKSELTEAEDTTRSHLLITNPNFSVVNIKENQEALDGNAWLFIAQEGGRNKLWYKSDISSASEAQWLDVVDDSQIDPNSPLGLKSGIIFWLDKNEQTFYGYDTLNQSLFGAPVSRDENETLLDFQDKHSELWQAVFKKAEHEISFRKVQ